MNAWCNRNKRGTYIGTPYAEVDPTAEVLEASTSGAGEGTERAEADSKKYIPPASERQAILSDEGPEEDIYEEE